MTEEKTINMTSPTGRKPANGNLPERPGRDPVQCDMILGNPPCGMGSHGFICHFPDGSCLRYKNQNMEVPANDQNLQSPAAE